MDIVALVLWILYGILRCGYGVYHMEKQIPIS